MPPFLFGLLEWFGESLDPGSQGSLAVAAPEVRWRPSVVVVLHAAMALMLLGTASYFIVAYTVPAWGWLIGWLVGLMIYLLAAHYLVPDADTDNFGWFGGLMDNPLRWSDDWNRMLLFLWLFLMPGRFISVGLRDGLVWCFGDYPTAPFSRTKKRRRV
jgi:hypothetical protein